MPPIRSARPTLSTTLAFAAAAALTALVAQPARAKDEAAPTAMIKLDPVQLASGEDLPSIRSQIATAAHRVCKSEDHTLRAQMVAHECFDRVLRSGEAQYFALRVAGIAPLMAKSTKLAPVRALAAAEQNRAR